MNWEDDDLDQTLQSLRDEPLSEAALAEVRARVRLEIERRQHRRWWLWMPVPTLVGALALVLMFWPGGSNRTTKLPERAAGTNPAPPDASANVSKGSPKGTERAAAVKERPAIASNAHPRAAARVIKRVSGVAPSARAATAKEHPAEAEDTQFVKLITDDPDVVILWAMDRTGDSQ